MSGKGKGVGRDPILGQRNADEPVEETGRRFLEALKEDRLLIEHQQHLIPSFHQSLVLRTLRIDSLKPGHVIFNFTVTSSVANRYRTFHGGAVAMVASTAATIAVQTLAKERALSLTELSVSYASASPIQAQLKIEAKVLRFGKSLATVSVDVTDSSTKAALYQSRATFYSMPTSSL
eukprot:TRINITY_DN970_c0_g1_i1.p1 TRINITY_DN970_c0_g1~~TRINITY_DN970_c0_g1_i1.p1  ORF type:complete len:177 (-),score=16.06 TRINITY_DN970_c0_g1_i1:320-850(-)